MGARAPPTSNHRQTVILAAGYFDILAAKSSARSSWKRFFGAT
jgi:hypothetical protein